MDLYGIVGYPLTHSFSPSFFMEKFSKESIDATYVKFEIADISLFSEIIATNENLKGLNVTIPYKEQIMKFLDRLDPQAESIGAINVIKVNRNEGEVELIGYNSDIIGFQNSLYPLLNKETHAKALILGTGGASKAVAKALENLNVNYTFVSRAPKDGFFIYENLNEEIMKEYKIIINTSPVGTFPNVEEAPNIPYKFISSEHLLYDLVYNPEETQFLRLGKEQGAIVKNGAEMLQLQALAAWDIWNS